MRRRCAKKALIDTKSTRDRESWIAARTRRVAREPTLAYPMTSVCIDARAVSAVADLQCWLACLSSRSSVRCDAAVAARRHHGRSASRSAHDWVAPRPCDPQRRVLRRRRPARGAVRVRGPHRSKPGSIRSRSSTTSQLSVPARGLSARHRRPRHHAPAIEVRPEATILTYAHAAFTVTADHVRADRRAGRSSSCSTSTARCR